MTLNLCIAWTFSPRSVSYVSCWVVSCPGFLLGALPSWPTTIKKWRWKFMWCDIPFGPYVAISNGTMLQVEYGRDRIHSHGIHNKACSLKSLLFYVLQGGLQTWQPLCLMQHYTGHIFMFAIKDAWTLDKKVWFKAFFMSSLLISQLDFALAQ